MQSSQSKIGPLISIIVPVYNVEKYLEQCVDSILKQTYSMFELILLNDGSSDSSGCICDKYEAQDKRVKVIHQRNLGVSSTRNEGIASVKGEYICFIDSDDWIDANYLQCMVDALEPGTDLVVSGFVLEKNIRSVLKPDDASFDFADKVKFHHLMKSRLLYGPCQKLFRATIIQKFHIQFIDNMSYGEDRMFNCAFLERVNRIVSVNQAAYHYRIHEQNSLSSKVYPNMFELEYMQWKAFYNLYQHKDLLTNESIAFHLRTLYWMIVDNIFNESQLALRKGLKNKYNYIRRILSTEEISDLVSHSDMFADISSTQFKAVIEKHILYFLFIHLYHKIR